jgi:hypothetical protein
MCIHIIYSFLPQFMVLKCVPLSHRTFQQGSQMETKVTSTVFIYTVVCFVYSLHLRTQ